MVDYIWIVTMHKIIPRNSDIHTQNIIKTSNDFSYPKFQKQNSHIQSEKEKLVESSSIFF